MHRLSGRWTIPLFVALAAVAVRVFSFVPGFTLRGVLGYDDTAYFANAQMFLEGHLPYKSFPVVQPPGVILVASPFAAAGQFVGGDIAMVLLRVCMILLAGLTCALIADLLRPWGVLAALAGSLTFAASDLAVKTGRTFYLEPFLVFATVATFWLLRSGSAASRRLFLTGLLLGLAATIKIWAVADIAVVGFFLAATRSTRRALTWLSGVATAVLVVCLPFFILAPTTMWQELVSSQMRRGGGPSLTYRLARLSPLPRPPTDSASLSDFSAQLIAIFVITIAVLPLGIQIARSHGPRKWNLPAWWAFTAAVQVLVLAAAPTFYTHYLVWPLGMMALGIGWSVGRLEQHAKLAHLLALTVIVAASMVVPPYRFRTHARVLPTATVRSFAASHDCTYFGLGAIHSFATSRDVPAWAPCRPWPDPIGTSITMGAGRHRDPALDLRDLPQWQAATRRQLEYADSVVLCTPLEDQPFDTTTMRFFEHRFRLLPPSAHSQNGCTRWVLYEG